MSAVTATKDRGWIIALIPLGTLVLFFVAPMAYMAAVSVFKNDRSAISTHLTFHSRAMPIASPQNVLSNARRAGERNVANARMLGHELAGQFTTSGQDIDDSRREACFFGKFADVQS